MHTVESPHMDQPSTAHFRIGWRLFWARPGIFVMPLLVMFASWVLLEGLVIELHELGVAFNLLVHAAFLVVFCGLAAGLAALSLDVLSGREARLETLFGSLRRGPRVLAAGLLYLVWVIHGLVLLVAPGIYHAVHFGLFGMVVATTEVSAWKSLGVAATLTHGRWGEACSFFLRVVLLNLAGAALLGVGLLVSVPVTLLATASYYRSLTGMGAPAG